MCVVGNVCVVVCVCVVALNHTPQSHSHTHTSITPLNHTGAAGIGGRGTCHRCGSTTYRAKNTRPNNNRPNHNNNNSNNSNSTAACCRSTGDKRQCCGGYVGGITCSTSTQGTQCWGAGGAGGRCTSTGGRVGIMSTAQHVLLLVVYLQVCGGVLSHGISYFMHDTVHT